jgi:hypothetical protein
MSVKAYIACKYQVKFGTSLPADEFQTNLERIVRDPNYEGIMDWTDPSHTMYDLDKSKLQHLMRDADMSPDLREFARVLVESSDPELEYVRVELF